MRMISRAARLAIVLAGSLFTLRHAPGAAVAAPIVCFSPSPPGGCDPTATVVRAVDGARRTIRVQMYAFTARPILRALLRAHARGVDVRVIVDRRQFDDDRYDTAAVSRLVASGVPVLVDTVPGLMHDKIMIVDHREVLTGSFNYSWSAEHRNAENLLLLHNATLVADYTRNWAIAAARSLPLAALSESARLVGRGSGEFLHGPVRGNRRSHIYEWPGCPYYDRIAPYNRVAFASAQAAHNAGYRPARNCP